MKNYKGIYDLVRREFKSYVTEASYTPAGATNVIYDDYCSDYKYDDLLFFWFLHSLLSVNAKAEYLIEHHETNGRTLRKIIDLINDNAHLDEETKSNAKKIIDYLDNRTALKPPKIKLSSITQSEKKSSPVITTPKEVHLVNKDTTIILKAINSQKLKRVGE
ncbi:hypothetical protein GC101_34055 [Paenibacillus sp. LMG 31459]|uniref:Uncharacterized protein n=1 Tax=Paenibacillus phytohabitans TaxID=2654978 RepID=A0ABX1YS20_9BACL|nr:hypothetical protein [Paenibacillus phytohabitans]NOU83880.1 hypothetical protein [Paenibacillus phytohabitans]